MMIDQRATEIHHRRVCTMPKIDMRSVRNTRRTTSGTFQDDPVLRDHLWEPPKADFGAGMRFSGQLSLRICGRSISGMCSEQQELNDRNSIIQYE